jgi:hypothetical protein
LEYVVSYLFKERLGVIFQHSTSLEEALQHVGLVINYSNDSIPRSLQIIPTDILFQSTIDYWDLDFSDNEHNPIEIKATDHLLSFDLFSAVFYLLSRYEEYTTMDIDKDEHQRFDVHTSSLFKAECLQYPLVDIWLMSFKKLLISDYAVDSNLFKKDAFYIQATIDIDSIFAYKGKGFKRTLMASINDLFCMRFSNFSQRIKVLLGKQKDPFDNFDELIQLFDEFNTKVHFFFQIGPYGPFDKNIDAKHSRYKEIIEKIQKHGHCIGIHPSYQSDSNIEKVKAEIHTLQQITNQAIKSSRQHYLRFQLPQTYECLLNLGITQEFSMGYSNQTGFRAGTAFPFYWFNLKKNKSTFLQIVPFSVMDVCFKEYYGDDEQSAINKTEHVKQQLKTLNAPFCFVFHNESYSEINGWNHWKKVIRHWLNA